MSAQHNGQLLAELDALDALFSDESKWTTGTCARNGAGESVCVEAEDATCWCLFGGCIKVGSHGHDGRDTPLQAAIRREARIGQEFAQSWAAWNDRRTFADVKRLIADTKARLLQQDNGETK